MARKKKYIEHEVIDKAMNLFWRNGYETTSMSMLEKEMGINKFSIYASFGSKDGVFLESIKLYRAKLQVLLDKLAASQNGVEGIKEYFYDFLEFSKDSHCGKGCLVSNSANEFGPDADAALKAELTKFTADVRQLFANTLAQDRTKNAATVEEQADYLIISMLGLANASRLFGPSQLDHFIANIFTSI